MASIGTRLQERLANLLFSEFEVAEVRDMSPHFRRFRVSGESLRGDRCEPGAKVQIMVSGAGPRTFSPFAPDGSAGTFDFVAFVHGDEPAARWCRRATSGLRFRAFGPRGSLPLSSIAKPIVLFGDETSLGTAKSLWDVHGSSAGLSFLFEASDPSECRSVLDGLGVAPCDVVQRRASHAHLDELEARLQAAYAQAPSATLVLTGHAQTIQALRARLKAWNARPGRQKIKPYWADGKRGLD